MENELSLMPVFQIIKLVFVMAIGIVYDILMIQFLQKRKNSIGPGQVKLVPWKSSSDTNKENNILVPVSATIASLVGVIGNDISLNYSSHILTYADFDKGFNGYSDSFVLAVKAAQTRTLTIQHEVGLVDLMTIVRHHKLAIDISIRVKMQSIT